jgi:PilZ domain
MTTEPNRVERRAAQRFEVHLPVAVHFDGRTMPGFTQDLSGRGIFFYTEADLPTGVVVELTFTMPSEITLGESIPVRGRGRVLRSAPAQGGRRNGVAVQLDSYEYLPADAREPIAQFVRVSTATAGAARPVHR